MEKTKCHGNSTVTCSTETSSHKSRHSRKKGVREFCILNFFFMISFRGEILCLHCFGQGNEEGNYGPKNLRDRFPFPLAVFHRNCSRKWLKMRILSRSSKQYTEYELQLVFLCTITVLHWNNLFLWYFWLVSALISELTWLYCENVTDKPRWSITVFYRSW